MSHIKEFQRIVMSYGLLVFIRRTMGEDIAGACGQLVLQKGAEGSGSGSGSGSVKKGREGKGASDIEDALSPPSASAPSRRAAKIDDRRKPGPPGDRSKGPAGPRTPDAAGGPEPGPTPGPGAGRPDLDRDWDLGRAAVLATATLGAGFVALGLSKIVGRGRR